MLNRIEPADGTYCYELTEPSGSRTLMISPAIFRTAKEAYDEGVETAKALAETGCRMAEVWAYRAKNAAAAAVVGTGGAK